MNRRLLSHPSIVSDTVGTLKKGGLVVYPTDTLYGFGVIGTDGEAIQRINRIKGRTGPMSVIAPDTATARTWARCTPDEWATILTELGGATTVIFPVKPGIVHPSLLGPDHSLGVRIPRQPSILSIVARLGQPLTTTSVNRTGQAPCNDPDEIERQFGSEIDLLIDGGHLPASSGSRIFKLDHSTLKMIRP
ncbi:MAG: L-threonylcarbamoyladenylate synthase [Fidelibacterota bacterium]